MIIEFNGLPGTGKTTVSQVLKEQLEKEHNVRLRYGFTESKIAKYTSCLFDGSIILYILARQYIKKSAGFDDKQKNEYISVLIIYYRMYRHFLKHYPNDILITDQGIVQALVSINHGDAIIETKELTKIMSYINKKGIRFLSINCKNSVELSKERIKFRNTNIGRLDSCGEEEREKILKIQTGNFEIIRNELAMTMVGCRSLDIDTEISAEDNSTKIITFLSKMEEGI